jgi:hypothetical protein
VQRTENRSGLLLRRFLCQPCCLQLFVVGPEGQLVELVIVNDRRRLGLLNQLFSLVEFRMVHLCFRYEGSLGGGVSNPRPAIVLLTFVVLPHEGLQN